MLQPLAAAAPIGSPTATHSVATSGHNSLLGALSSLPRRAASPTSQSVLSTGLDGDVHSADRRRFGFPSQPVCGMLVSLAQTLGVSSEPLTPRTLIGPFYTGAVGNREVYSELAELVTVHLAMILETCAKGDQILGPWSRDYTEYETLFCLRVAYLMYLFQHSARISQGVTLVAKWR
jgi:hypothetical protein